MKLTKSDLIKEIFFKDTLTEYQITFYLQNIDKAIQMLPDERMQCLIKKRYSEQCTLKESGKQVLRIDGKNPCSGVTQVRAGQIIAKAIRMLRHPRRKRIILGIVD